MQAIAYQSAKSIDEAVSVLRQWGERARVLSGGTDLIAQLREGRRHDVEVVLDIKSIPEARELRYSPGQGLYLGAAVPCYRIYEDAAIARAYPALADSAALIGGIQIQSRAAIGGNLCNASPAADAIPSLIALGATCEIAGPNGRRTLPVEQFCIGPGRSALEQNEFLVALRLPSPAAQSGSCFLRFIPRNEMDIAVANAAVALTLNPAKDRITAARVAIGAVAPTPLLVPEAAAALIGAPLTEATLERAAEAARAAARPITDMRGSIAQRRHLARVLTRRAIESAIQRAKES
ncbi:MAG: xanthine dehydrogenase family protein subunit M [Dehalococcoidia bacterium]|nr:xanthine dehydrogenase family protein subunit M [Dehalococcoidia bacterium]